MPNTSMRASIAHPNLLSPAQAYQAAQRLPEVIAVAGRAEREYKRQHRNRQPAQLGRHKEFEPRRQPEHNTDQGAAPEPNPKFEAAPRWIRKPRRRIRRA